MRTIPRRSAYTMTEMVVVIAITCILIALSVVAIQKARAAAARTECGNNLKQIGLALAQYHDANKALPAGLTYQRPTWYWSWMAMILPYLDQGSLYDEAYQFASSTSSDPWSPNPALSVQVTEFRCPADGRLFLARTTYGYDVAFTSYLGVAGTPGDLSDRDPSGLLYYSSRVNFSQITSGASNTFMVGERPPSADYWFGWWFAGTGFDDSAVGDHLLGAQQTDFLAWINSGADHCPAASAHFQPGDTGNHCDLVHYWSLHRQGSNFLLADGSVQFVSYGISQTTFTAMCSRESTGAGCQENGCDPCLP